MTVPRYYKDHARVILLHIQYLLLELQISNGNNFFIDEKLNGLFLIIIDVAV